MGQLRTLTPEQLVGEIQRKLQAKPRSSTWHEYKIAPDPVEPAAYTLIVGAGFSFGVVPLTSQLMRETIGDYYLPDQDNGAFGQRPPQALKRHAATFWAEFNDASKAAGLKTVELDDEHLPTKPGDAYQTLFSYDGANALFRKTESRTKKKGFLDRLLEERESTGSSHPEKDRETGKRFVRGFLRYVLSPGSEHGWGSTGRNDLNDAHIHLAAMLEAQQLGKSRSGAFCRTIFTTNFDTLLQVALQQVHLLYMITDRPERGLDLTDFPEEEEAIHLVYTHGSILRHNPSSAVHELAGLAERNVRVLRDFLQQRDVITIGYGGWEDSLMAALRLCDSSKHKLYWCDVRSRPNDEIEMFLEGKGDAAAYVLLKDGADGLMRMVSETLISRNQSTGNQRGVSRGQSNA